jgi:tripartite-type tricarboxylate transporter receptor subunit TctC/glyoxylase-like metal-dependent hydrolase (beta-lactamase superfamily II)
MLRTCASPPPGGGPGEIPRRTLPRVAAALALPALRQAGAQEAPALWPVRQARIVMPFGAGAALDTMSRLIAGKLTRRLQATFIVENKPGAGGSIGTMDVVRAAPNGGALLATSSSVTILPFLQPRLGIDPLRDLVPISLLTEFPIAVAVRADSSLGDLADLVARAKAAPGRLTYGSGGVGSAIHMASALFASMANIEMLHIPYGGFAQAFTALHAGTIDLLFGASGDLPPARQQAGVRVLGVGSARRIAAAPDVPAINDGRARLHQPAMERVVRAARHAAGAGRARRRRTRADARRSRPAGTVDRWRDGDPLRRARAAGRTPRAGRRDLARFGGAREHPDGMTQPMFTYALYAIRYATREARRAEHFLGGDPRDESMPMDYYVWAAIGPERSFVIDTGLREEVARARDRSVLRCPVESLRLIGLDPATVTDVILTHLHYDHTGNIGRFPVARFHLQEREMHYATGRYLRHPRLGATFDPDDICALVRLNFARRLFLYDGVAELAPGITLHRLGGHSAGLQCVRVATQSGPVVIASDVAHFYENMETGRPFPQAFHVGEMLEGFDALRALAASPAHIVAGHDPEVMRRFPAAGPGLEGAVARLDAGLAQHT